MQEVELVRDSIYTPWGFRIQGGSDHGTPLIVSRIAPISAAEGLLNIGDVIMSINSQSTNLMPHAQASYLISNSGAHLKLNICRQSNMHQETPSGSRYQYTQKEMENKKIPIPTNKLLATLMTETVRDNYGQRPPNRGRGLTTTDLLERNLKNSNEDITRYLPDYRRPYCTLPSRRSAPSPSLRQQLASSLMRGSQHVQSMSGRSTPQSVLEFGDLNTGKRSAIGFWVPPTHQPGARLVHNQYNSPMGLYTPHNVADIIQKQTGTKLQWEKKPGVRFLDDIRDSETYKLVKEMEADQNGPNLRVRS